jgi:hypothetical protein
MANAFSNSRTKIAVNDQPDSSNDSFASLTSVQLAELLKALRAVGQYGEVHLVIADGRIRFMRIVQSLSFSQSSMKKE